MHFYNSSEYLNQSIHSILFKSHNDFELMLINDGSTDSSF